MVVPDDVRLSRVPGFNRKRIEQLEAREVAKRLGEGDFDADGAAPVIKSVIEDMFACESSLEEGLAIARGMDARLKLAAKAAR